MLIREICHDNQCHWRGLAQDRNLEIDLKVVEARRRANHIRLLMDENATQAEQIKVLHSAQKALVKELWFRSLLDLL